MLGWRFTAQSRSASNLRFHSFVIGAYALLACALTWPLLRHFHTHMPGDGIDDPALAWNLWWIKDRLVDQQNLDIFHSGWMFFPIEINLGFYTLTPLNGLLSVPLQTGLDLIVAANVILLGAYIVGAYGAFLLATSLLARTGGADAARRPLIRWAALAAGVVYAFASSRLFYASLGQFNIASTLWIPFAVLYILRTGETRRWRPAFLAGLFLTFQAWAELTYASFLLIFIALFFVWQLLAGRRLAAPGHVGSFFAYGRSLLPPFLLLGLVFVAGLLPFLWAMVPDLRQEGDFFASGGGFADVFSADVMGYLIPTRLHPLVGGWSATLPFPNDKGQHIFIGYSALLFSVAGTLSLWRALGWRGLFWPLMALWFWWLTLGPEVRWAGQATGIPGPFDLISWLPFFSGNRYPSRYSVMLMLCVSLLVGWGLVWIGMQARQRRRLFPALLSGFVVLFLFEHLSLPLPLNDFRVPSIYAQIAAQPEGGTLLELPTGWRNGARVMGRSDILIMMEQWYQTVHGKRRLGGNTSRNPDYKFTYFSEAPLIGDLIELMNADAQIDGRAYLAPALAESWDSLIARNRAIAPFVLDFLDVRSMTLHVEKSPPALVDFVEEALPVTLIEEWTGADWAGEGATIRLYAVVQDGPAGSAQGWQVDLGSPLGRLFAAEGWSPGGDSSIRYATRRQADLLLPLPAEGGRLVLALYGPAQLEQVYLNGAPTAWVARQEGEAQAIEVEVPAGSAGEVVDRLTLGFDGLYPLPALWGTETAGWPVGATGAVLPVDRPLFVRSAGKEAGDVAQIFMAGHDIAANEIGYNLAAFTPDGQLLETAAFNTLISAAESAAMAAWLERWPAGTVVAGAVRDEGSYNLGEDAVMALQRFGVGTDLRGHFRGSHAFIGVAGAPAGSAAESFAPFRQALVAAGPMVDAAHVSGGVGRIEFRRFP